MIKNCFFAFLFSSSIYSVAQTNLISKTPKESFDNIHVEKLSGDLTFTSFIIWVKKSVKPHYHKEHDENIYVIEGTGEMMLGKNNLTIKPGDYIHIPKGTVHSVKVTSKIPIKVLSMQSPEFDGTDRVFIDSSP